MSDLRAVVGPDVSGRTQVLLGAGLGLVLAGAAAVAAGLADVLVAVLPMAGVPEARAAQYALLVAGAIPPLALGLVAIRFSARRGRWLRRIGGALTAIALLGGWAFFDGTQASIAAVPTAILVSYPAGLVALYLGTTAGGLERAMRSLSGSTATSFDRRPTGPTDRVVPADGGEEHESNLDFPLDDEE